MYKQLYYKFFRNIAVVRMICFIAVKKDKKLTKRSIDYERTSRKEQ